MLEQIVNLQIARKRKRDAFQIPAGQFEIPIAVVIDQQNCANVAIQLAKRFAERLGLMCFQLPAVNHNQFFFRQLHGKRRTQRAQNHFPRQAIRIFVRHRAMNRAALAPERGADGTDTRASRALLFPKFASGTGNIGAALGLVRARALP